MTAKTTHLSTAFIILLLAPLMLAQAPAVRRPRRRQPRRWPPSRPAGARSRALPVRHARIGGHVGPRASIGWTP